MTWDYIRQPAAIYEASFATIEAEVDLARFSALEQRVLIRMIHACGMTGLSEDVQFWGDAAAAGAAAIAAGKPIFVDVEMLRHGIIRSRLTANNPIYCTTHDPRAVPKAAEIGNTRSAAGVDLWEPEDVEGAVVAIGNAPTALFRLMELIERGLMPKPACVVGVPVGFVGAVESKQALSDWGPGAGVPGVVVQGRRGGSAIAAAAVNALAAKNEAA